MPLKDEGNILTKLLYQPNLWLFMILLILISGRQYASNAPTESVLEVVWEAPQGFNPTHDNDALEQLKSSIFNMPTFCRAAQLPALDLKKPTGLYRIAAVLDADNHTVVYTKDTITEHFITIHWSTNGCPIIRHAGRGITSNEYQLLSPYPNTYIDGLDMNRGIFVLIQDKKAVRPWIESTGKIDFLTSNSQLWSAIGVYTGSLVLLSLIALTLFVWQKSALALAYLLYIVSLQFWQLQALGLGPAMLPFWPGPEYFPLMRALTVAGVVLGIGNAVLKFLDLKGIPRKLIITGLVFSSAGYLSSAWTSFGYNIGSLVLALLAILSLYYLILGLKQRLPGVWWFALGLASTLIGGGIQATSVVTGGGMTGAAGFAFPISTAFESICWLIALSIQLRADRRHMLAEKLEAQEMATNVLTIAKDHLEEEVKIRTNELQLAMEEADRANSAKTLFLSHMSHELRTPLNAIIGFSALMRADKNLVLPESHEQGAKLIHESGQHLLALIDDFLDVTKIEAGKLSIHLQSVLFIDLIEDALAVVEPMADARNIKLVNQTEPEQDWYVFADKTRVRQIITNILTNAIKYNQIEGQVNITLTRNESHTRLSISDTGIGIAAENLKEIFEPFSRVSDQVKDVDGTGIGLTITKRLAELMNGRVQVESELEKGSTFIFELPNSEQILPESKISEFDYMPFNSSGEDQETNFTVLYIEDVHSNIVFMEHIVKMRPNVRLLTEKSGSTGIRSALANKPGLILCDMHLPDIMGIDVVTRLKNSPETAHIPIVALSASINFDKYTKSQIELFEEMMQKPVEIEAILALLDRMYSPGKNQISRQ